MGCGLPLELANFQGECTHGMGFAAGRSRVPQGTHRCRAPALSPSLHARLLRVRQRCQGRQAAQPGGAAGPGLHVPSRQGLRRACVPACQCVSPGSKLHPAWSPALACLPVGLGILLGAEVLPPPLPAPRRRGPLLVEGAVLCGQRLTLHQHHHGGWSIHQGMRTAAPDRYTTRARRQEAFAPPAAVPPTSPAFARLPRLRQTELKPTLDFMAAPADPKQWRGKAVPAGFPIQARAGCWGGCAAARCPRAPCAVRI